MAAGIRVCPAPRLAADGPVTLLTATRDLSLSQAAVLADLLQDTT